MKMSFIPGRMVSLATYNSPSFEESQIRLFVQQSLSNRLNRFPNALEYRETSAKSEESKVAGFAQRSPMAREKKSTPLAMSERKEGSWVMSLAVSEVQLVTRG